ncbi:MAG TPA: ABC transporter ATP-binding protein, partial [bacterium]|nr:ABC transporter ATP-binding protein [bacterium]
MSNQVAIQIEGLGKRYRLGQTVDLRRTFRETLVSLPRFVGHKAKTALKTALQSDGNGVADPETPLGTFWALRDVNLQIQRGEATGIIGRNGAGKSTLLKILSRITAPTKGRAEIHGRLSSLLEVGTGFHSELTGRENIYLNGAILGMRKAEIDRKFDEIVAFAEIDRFLDTPVKRYSSGMYVRLAFAVAAHLEPEILVIDEVLAVGDIQFQKKCLGRMGEVTQEGRTVLFVSHNMEAVRNLCQKGILLDKGKVVARGSMADVIHEYTQTGAPHESCFRLPPPVEKDFPGHATELIVEDQNGTRTNSVPVGKPWQVRVRFRVLRRIEHFIMALGLRT